MIVVAARGFSCVAPDGPMPVEWTVRTGGDLLDDEFLGFRRTSRHGFFVQPQPHERRYQQGSLPGRTGWIAVAEG